MPILKNVLGLDLGSHTLKAVELAQGLRTLEVLRLHAEPRSSELPLAEQVDRMLTTHSFGREHVITAVRGDRLSVRMLEFPFAEKRRLAQAVPFEIEDRVPFDIDEMCLDWEVSSSERGRASVISALAPREEVSRLIESLDAARCGPRVIEAEGLALANLDALFSLPQPCLLVDVGHEKTTFCALEGGRARSARSIGLAGRAFTEAIAQERSLSLADAERAKHESGVTGVARAEDLLRRLSNEALRFATAAEPQLSERIAGIVLLGGGSQLAGLDRAVTEYTGIPADALPLPDEETGVGLAAGGSPQLFGPALALALRGSPRARSSINLRQDDFARRADFSWVRREFGTTGVLAAAVAGMAVLSVAVGAVLERGEAHSVEERAAALYAEAFPGREVPENPMAAMREAVRDANERAEFLGVYRGNLSALDVLTEISRRIPPDLDVGFEELSIDKQTIRIRVYAKSFEAADRLGAELSKFGPFEEARIGAIETDNKTGIKKFNVTISLAAGESA